MLYPVYYTILYNKTVFVTFTAQGYVICFPTLVDFMKVLLPPTEQQCFNVNQYNYSFVSVRLGIFLSKHFMFLPNDVVICTVSKDSCLGMNYRKCCFRLDFENCYLRCGFEDYYFRLDFEDCCFRLDLMAGS